MKTVFSGTKPTGKLHLGNYIGSLSQWVKNQDKYNNVFCIVDLHAITVLQEPKALKESTKSLVAWYLAAGLDPKKSIIFVQSHNSDHTQLCWILNCFIGMGKLSRMTQYKEKKEKADFTSVGLFDYPSLMAADILLYDADLVPVGEDQKQHIELTRDVAQTMNFRYGNLFTLPEYLPPFVGERVMSLQSPENKMSKSETDPLGTINLEDSPDTIKKKVLSAVTDTGNEIKISADKPAISNLIKIFMALSGKEESQLDATYSGKGYKKFKEDLAEVVIASLLPIQEKYKQLMESGTLEDVLRNGLVRAKEKSTKKLARVENAIGLG